MSTQVGFSKRADTGSATTENAKFFERNIWDIILSMGFIIQKSILSSTLENYSNFDLNSGWQNLLKVKNQVTHGIVHL